MTQRNGLFSHLWGQYRAWRAAQYWTPEAHLRFIRARILEDHRALGHTPLAAEVYERLWRMTARDWYHRDHEPVEAFRARMGLDIDTGLGDLPRPTLFPNDPPDA